MNQTDERLIPLLEGMGQVLSKKLKGIAVREGNVVIDFPDQASAFQFLLEIRPHGRTTYIRPNWVTVMVPLERLPQAAVTLKRNRKSLSRS